MSKRAYKDKHTHVAIDACIAQSAGGKDAGSSIASRACRGFLLAAQSAGLHAAMTDELPAEWRRHQSNFARSWLLEMTSRKRVQRLGTASPDPALAERLLDACPSPQQRDAVAKDLHLLAAALSGDGAFIASSEVKIRHHFRRVCPDVLLASVDWINPSLESDRCREWLDTGFIRLQRPLCDGGLDRLHGA